MSVSVFDHPVLSGWAGDEATRLALSFEADLAAMLRFESALARSQADLGLVPDSAAVRIGQACAGFQPDIAALRASTARDGVVVPGLIDQLRRAVDAPARQYLHMGATSQDVVDTSLMLRLKPLLAGYERQLEALETEVGALADQWGDRPLMAVTRMRAALPFSVGDRLCTWKQGLVAARHRLRGMQDTGLALQFAGPVGTLDKFTDGGGALRAALAERLGLPDPGGPWHVERSRMFHLATTLAQTTQATGKIGIDVALMVQDGIDALALTGGSSSSMPHKVNPVDAELLVALARKSSLNLGAAGLSAVHENERSGISWTLEWLCFPDLLASTGAALGVTARLLRSFRRMGPERPANP
ncbi:3-carboxy-cis,cis-muconate cycloisomerase [Oceaniglobus trochenteri]|uniref:3-carboxy-cis,cis-muconate cycloisomerase n=1 Tax=Oceaniglobus trochenteri TaxID=2763260 RepID=UPI001CFFA16D|nr:3-carboxy-cis,cis-muconate cycloisomerase [Oceaniglobus trochenteri]